MQTAAYLQTVTCPKCSSQFYLEDQIAMHTACSYPFHCSRCDNLFNALPTKLTRPSIDLRQTARDTLQPAKLVTAPTHTILSQQLLLVIDQMINSTALKLLTAPCCCLVVLFFITYSPTMAGLNMAGLNIASKLISGSRQAPPPGLVISHLHFTSPADHQLPLLTGTVLNSSPQTVDQVLIEGLLFDQDGKRLSREFAYVQESTEALPNFTQTEIDDLSNRIPNNTPDPTPQTFLGGKASQSKLLPGESKVFTIAFPAKLLKQARLFFSARVHSVQA